MERKPHFEPAAFDTLSATVQYVFRANFNDTYHLDTVKIRLDELPRDRLVWFDPYCGRSKSSNTEIAVLSVSGKEFTILERVKDTVTEHKRDVLREYIVCEDYDDSRLLATHIRTD